MKRLILFLSILFFVISSAATVSAEEVYDEQYFSEKLFSEIDSDTYDVLNSFGIDGLDVGQIFSASLDDITKYFSDSLKTRITGCAKDFWLYMCIILISATVSAIFDIKKHEKLLNLISITATVIVTINIISPLINMIISALEANGNFMIAYIPVFTVLVSISGSPSAGITYNTLALLFSEFISFFINQYAVKFIGLFYALSISFAFNPAINLNLFINSVNKIISIIIGFVSSVFTAILTIRSVMSVAIDSVSVKGIRFLIGSLIPIVGSSISDAYSSIIGSFSLIKGSVAFIGILVSLIISFPAIAEGTIYCIMFSILSDIADCVDSREIGIAIRVFRTGLKFLLLLSLLELFLLIISTGIMLTIKGGV